jgi:two-component system response regulator YesN
MTGKSSNGPPTSDQVVEYIYARDLETLGRLSVNELAKNFSTSRFRLGRKFEKEKNIKLSDFLTLVKMQRAAEILGQKGNKKIFMGRLARQLGYKTPEYFVNLFMRYFYIHPRAYREIKKGGPQTMQTRE